jgi:hypothetical protein
MDIDVSLAYGLTLLAALLIGAGFTIQQKAAAQEPSSRFLSLRLMLDLLRAPRWLIGIACMICGQILAAWSIGHLSLSFVEPLLTTNLVFALLLAVPLSGASIRFWEVTGALVLCLGVGLLSASRAAKPIGLSFGSFSHWPAAAVIAGIAFAAVHAGRRRQYRARAMLTGVGAGLVYGIQDALTRQTLEILQASGPGALFTTWAPYALVGAGATGIWLMQSAFSAGPLQFSLPAIAAGEPLVGILLGIFIFGDRIQITPGMLAMEAGGVAALIVGVIAVARAPALSALRGWTPHARPHGLPHVPGARHHGQAAATGVSSASGHGSVQGTGQESANGRTSATGDLTDSGESSANGAAEAHDHEAVNDARTAQRPERDMRGLRRLSLISSARRIPWAARSCSCRKAPTGRRTTASGSVMSCASAGTALCSRPSRHGAASWPGWASMRISWTWGPRRRTSPELSRKTPASTGRISSLPPRRSSASPRSSSLGR